MLKLIKFLEIFAFKKILIVLSFLSDFNLTSNSSNLFNQLNLNQIPFISSYHHHHHQNSSSKPLRIAIIGGGPAGTSAAFFLSRLSNQSRNHADIHLFESSNRIGGRVLSIKPFDSDQFQSIEAGASIFVGANKHLNHAAKIFNLSLQDYNQDKSENGPIAIWDGTEFVFEETGSEWWDTLKLVWRYGRAPFQLSSINKQTINQFEQIYKESFISIGPFDSFHEWLSHSGLLNFLPITGSDYLINQKSINLQAVNELAAIFTRTNYGQDISNIHALATLVSLAGKSGRSVIGGNHQIFQHFLNQSQSKLHLNHQIHTISQSNPNKTYSNPQYLLSYHQNSKNLTATTDPFDIVIIAAPFHQSGLTLQNIQQSIQLPSIQPYVRLHVTFIITNSTSPSGELFGKSKDQTVSRMIYSTMMRNVLGKGKRPVFNTVNYLKNLGQKDGVIGDMHIVKIFSEAPVTTGTLQKLFKHEQNLLWVKRLEWDAYPFLNPIQSDFPPIQLTQGIYYVNGFESFMSTMETQTLMSFNIASLITKNYWNFNPKRNWIDE
ncbi:hypothetical protein O181_003691 [Austropuccinia psidii MF-1]|uniref:Prenylcysteine lyase domain-containing protein n=1 Tax=Austropuccinia psidii MF-1 TaxID=1389203 RepID=A0A9Q3GED2_9BASI|nr:hypothetical protein [Austropuccinia psidii MF-1]